MGAGQKDCHLRHHHARAWFEAPLPSAAARNDLNLQLKVLKYRLVAVLNTLQCIRRHHWYLTGPMVALALADRGLEDEEALPHPQGPGQVRAAHLPCAGVSGGGARQAQARNPHHHLHLAHL